MCTPLVGCSWQVAKFKDIEMKGALVGGTDRLAVTLAQATVETVIKVSGNKHAEDVKAEKAAEKAEAEKEKEDAERDVQHTLPPTPPPPPETVVESIIHHSWGHLSADPKDIQVVWPRTSCE